MKLKYVYDKGRGEYHVFNEDWPGDMFERIPESEWPHFTEAVARLTAFGIILVKHEEGD